ncbi:MAG: hypothetical protein SOW56_04105 [Bacteroidaceae bacterium]|nr:hypothetical protein [Bacteroidaceae bacterium]
MNASVYLFGRFNNGYTQYPNDYTSAIFGRFYEKSKSTTQIVIHRDNNMMYYGYIRKLEANDYIGFCVVLNGLLLTRIDSLFSLFENVFAECVIKGHLVYFNECGSVVSNVNKLYTNKEEIDLLTEDLRVGFNRLEGSITSLPSVRYSVSKDSVKEYVIDDDLAKIVTSSYTNGYTFIYKSRGYNTAYFNSYKGVLARTSKEKAELKERLYKLQTEYEKTLRKKKQFKVVLILFVVLICSGVGIFYLNDSLKITRNALSGANNALSGANKTIIGQKDSLKNLNNQLSNLYDEKRILEKCLNDEKKCRIQAETKYEEFKNNIENYQSLVVKSTSYNFSTGYLSIDYFGIKTEVMPITIRVYSENGLIFNISASINVIEGDNSSSVYLGKNIKNNKFYSFEILKENKIIGGGRN